MTDNTDIKHADVEQFTAIFEGYGEITFAGWTQEGERVAAIAIVDPESEEVVIPTPLDAHLRTCEGCRLDLTRELSVQGYQLLFYREQLRATQ